MKLAAPVRHGRTPARLPVRLERAPHRGAAFALSNASKRARIRSIGARSRGSLFTGSRSRGSLLIFRSSPAVAPPSIFLLRRLSPALVGLSLRVSPDAWGRSGLGANDGGIGGRFRH